MPGSQQTFQRATPFKLYRWWQLKLFCGKNHPENRRNDPHFDLRIFSNGWRKPPNSKDLVGLAKRLPWPKPLLDFRHPNLRPARFRRVFQPYSPNAAWDSQLPKKTSYGNLRVPPAPAPPNPTPTRQGNKALVF